MQFSCTERLCHYIHSFIHYGDLYSAPSRLQLRSAPDPCTAKKKSFETRVECVTYCSRLTVRDSTPERILGSNLCDNGSPFHTGAYPQGLIQTKIDRQGEQIRRSRQEESQTTIVLDGVWS